MDHDLDANRVRDPLPRPANPLGGGREAPPAGSPQATGLPNREAPVSPPHTPRPGNAPAGRPPSAALADRYQDHLRSLMDGPKTHQGMNRLLWEHGEPIQRITAERPPTEVEKAAFREIARNLKDPRFGDHLSNLKQGEYAGTLDLRLGADGRPEVLTLSHGYFPGGSSAFNAPEGSRPALYYHSHPDYPALDSVLGRPHTANAMPSWQDQVSAAGHYASHGAKNYLITGDKVKVYDGKGGVTDLKPSPLEGELPRMGTPLPSRRPEEPPGTPASIRWDAPAPVRTQGSAGSSGGRSQSPPAPERERTPASPASSEGLFQRPLGTARESAAAGRDPGEGPSRLPAGQAPGRNPASQSSSESLFQRHMGRETG